MATKFEKKQSKRGLLRVASLLFLTALTVSVQAQRINGAVYGGGRMADVNGSTLVTIIKCDTISAVYGGNDIAGKVCAGGSPIANDSSFMGSQVVIGVNTNKYQNNAIHIGSVYGGGNGYYSYSDASGNLVHDTTISGTPTQIRNYVTTSALPTGSHIAPYIFTGDGSSAPNIVANAEGLFVPQTPKTQISVNTLNSYIDSLFGGAKNAFVTTSGAGNTSAKIDLRGGTIFALFGGNNFGGALGENSKQQIFVKATKIDDATSLNLGGKVTSGNRGTAWTSDNSGHGVRYLFGGGNKVAGQNVEITVNGGQIDTLFAGGNSADVRSTSVTVNVTDPLYTMAESPYTDPVNNAYSTTTSVFDIRCLFGGNNNADMAGLPTLTLTKGGIHNVYGGGNKGVMMASESYTDNFTLESLTPTSTTNHGSGAKKSTNVLVNAENILIDTIYGGGQSAGTLHDTYVEIANGNVGVVYGGTNITGNIGTENASVAMRNEAKTNVYIHGGTVHNTVFGASNGMYRCHNGMYYDNADENILFPSPDPYANLKGVATPGVFCSYVYITTGATIKGNVYSSGNMAVVGRPNAISGNSNVAGLAILHIDGGTIGTGSAGTITKEGNVFGGGNMGSVYGGSSLVIKGSPVIYGNVYGGNDKTGRIFSPLRNDASVLELAHTSSAAAVSVDNDDYQGLPDITAGNGISLNDENAAAYTLITGTPQIYGTVYGGGNGDYIYTFANFDAYQSALDAHTTTATRDRVVFQCTAPPDANQRSSFVDVNITGGAGGGYINRVFGGGNSMTSGHAWRNNHTIEETGSVYVFLNCTGSDPSDDNDNISVGTIFGGNNNVEMDRVPRIVMLKGKVGNVYGGGNMGNMTANQLIEDLPLSTYVVTPSDKVVVTGNVYGGCNVADVSHDTYVEISKGTIRGNIFGGNDLSGEVGISHVIIDGPADANLTIRGNVYGGGNGDYPFYAQLSDANGAYYLKSDHTEVRANVSNPAAVGATAGKYCAKNFEFFNMDGRPYVDSTAVVLNGKFTMQGNVYGGGISGDCRKTNVLVDAADGDFEGMIFGAGRGRVDNMGLRIGTCHDTYIGVAQDANNDGVTDRDGSDDVVYGTSNAMGNVLDTAFLTVRRFKSMRGTHSAMFGGGQAGNVRTTMVVYESTATAHLPALYLGCLASDVTNTATGIINANESNLRDALIDTIYGGNDFTGRVNRTDLTINSGVFEHVFGAGNGDYDYKTWIINRIGDAEHQGPLYENMTAVSAPGCADTVPYTMEVNVTINGGTFLNTIYGGGNMGLVGNRDMVAANMTSATATRHNDIGRITVNIHNGDFHRHVFTGARGKTDMKSKFFSLTGNNVNSQPLGKQLAYAQKILNMDGGHVAFSVYGGSEAVDDGFPHECYNSTVNTTTTLRPSSVLNITGGRIEKSVYGGGYQGNIYGSVYVNIGIDAVRDCKAWDYTNGTFAMADYKPNLTDHSGYDIRTTYSEGNIVKTRVPKPYTNIAGRPTLRKGIIDLESSVYNASDWGEAGSNSYFNTRGVFGGVTHILIDGKGYYTSLTNPFDVDLPSMNIANSIIGAGTSTEGGDVNRLIVVRHFGDYSCPDPSKSLFSIQRADKVVLDSVFVNLLGDQDAFSAFASPNYSLCRIDTLVFRIDNIITIESPAIYLGNVSSMKTDETVDINDPNQIYDNSIKAQDVEVPAAGSNPAVYSDTPNDFFDNLSGGNSTSDCNNNNDCSSLDICLKLPNARGNDGSVLAANVLMMRNGSYVKISPFVDAGADGLDDPNHSFGHVYGWMFLLAQDQTMSYVYADVKESEVNNNDGGFVAPCYCDNFSGTYPREIDYINVDIAASNADYRSWKVGTKQGTRVRNITLVANAVPDDRLNHMLPSGHYDVYVGSETTAEPTDITIANNSGYAYATTYLELPPADGGSFYIINSVLIDQDNGGQLVLVDQGYDASRGNFSQTTSSISLDVNSIAADPDYTFGLTFSSNENFNNASCWNTGAIGSVTANDVTRNLTESGVANDGHPYPCWNRTNISGNNHITNQGGYISNAIVANAVGAIPTMAFTLTYNTNIHTTIMRDVVFTMYEFNAQGQYVGPVEVTVTISTVIKDFASLEAPVLAMYNEGISDEYVRKVTIPASFQQRDVYIEGIEWMKDNDVPDGTYTVYEDPTKEFWFNMIQYGDTAVESNKHFSVLVKPTESTSGNVNNTLGWYHIEQVNGIDVYEEAARDYKATTGLEFSSAYAGKSDSIYNSLHYDGGTDDNHKTNLAGSKGNGIWLGTLDGRSTANIDVTLKFNGMYYYHNQFNPPLAWVRLKCHYYSTKTDEDGYFYINVKLRTRFEGDTIYMAAGPTLTRTAVNPDGETREITMHAYGYGYDPLTGQYPGGGTTPPNTPPNYSSITTHKGQIKGNPDNYLQDIRQAMLIYDEGDVIDIMEPIPITNGANPISVMGDDFSTIQIIRYSGSHYKFPTMGCANYGPLIDVGGSGFLTMRNVWFNGSGCTRTKEGVPTTIDPTISGQNVAVGDYNYYENHRRVQATLYADAPVIYCHGNGNVSFNRRVIITNNFNKNFDRDTTNTNATNVNYLGGGAIAVVKDLSTGAKPRVVLGDLCTLYDNLVVDWNAVTRNTNGGVTGTVDSLPKNYGGAVYVDGGELVLGTGSKGANLQISRNYYLKNMSDNSALKTKTAHVFADASETTMEEKQFQVYYLDTLEYPRSFALSNIYLTRKAYMCDNTDDEIDNPSPVTRRDEQNDVVYFLSEMDPASKVGISKWFPGYIYTNSRNEGYNYLNNTTPRDTIAIARIGKGKSNTAMVDNNYNANIFFNDSSYYSIEDRPGVGVVHPAATPSFGNIYPTVAYSQNTTGYQNHRDRVFIYRHTSLSQYNIYFQRCASFGKGVKQYLDTSDCFANSQNMQFNTYTKGDSISYHWNSEATCALAMDTIRFRVGGGFFPYTYQWSDVSDTVAGVVTRVPLHTRVTTGSNAIARFGTEGDEYDVMRTKAEYDTLVFRLHVNSSNDRYNYTYEVTATDLTGNCPVTQAVKVRVAKVATDHHDDGKFFYDYADFLLHRKHGALVGTTSADTANARTEERFYRITVPGVDSSSFHDHVILDASGNVIGGIPQHHAGPDAENPERGGIRRASYTHRSDTGNEPSTGADFDGLPYAGNNTDAVGDMTPRYLRLFRSYRVKPNIYPVAARGTAAQEEAEPPTSGWIDIYNAEGDNLLFSINRTNMSNDNWHSDKEFCPGEVLQLRPHPAEHSPAWEFIGWSFDPSANDTANFVVTDNVISNSPVIFYVPGDYWWQAVTSFQNVSTPSDDPSVATLADYKLDYYGNVEIKTKKGLAWLISTVNGYNGQNAQTFHFNTIRLDSTLTEPIDMSEHKWTPLGNVNNPFEGVFEGKGRHITNILVNEHTIPLVGMFGHTRGATIRNFTIDSTMVRGDTYVSAVVGEATENTVVDNVTIQLGGIFGEYTIGGFISHMVNSTLSNCRLNISDGSSTAGRIAAYGNAIYAGGFVGYAEGSTIKDNSMPFGYINISQLSAVYVGAMLGRGMNTVVTPSSKNATPTILNNNYAQLITSNKAQRVGGLVGYAEGMDINNNYVYGKMDYDKDYGFAGGLLGYVGDNVSLSNSYYVNGLTNNIVGFNSGSSVPQKSTTFKGQGNHVMLTESVDGYNNLTRALNAWVRDHGDTVYNTWRSDLENTNNGYPIFGTPDLIPVNDTLEVATCGDFEFDGISFDQSGTYIFHVVDSSDFVDSTLTLMLTVNYGDSTAIFDTIHFGEGYEGNGYSIASEDIAAAIAEQGRQGRHDIYTFIYVDSLYTQNGCDSLVYLTLYVMGNVDVPDVPQQLTDVKVYPNPTHGLVNVEGDALMDVEVYDNVSRRVFSSKVDGNKFTFDLSNHPTGSYYIRVRTSHGTVVKKLIKK